MAKKTIVTLTDDIDGSKAERTVEFTWQGVPYEIDLSKKNATAFEKVVAPYVEKARKVRGRGTRGRRPAAASTRSDLRAVREWAAANGYEVAQRGRISEEIREAYDAAR